MNYVESPDHWDGKGTGFFLGGGITDCPDWQSILTKKFAAEFVNEPVTVINPRHKNFPINDSQAAERQIKWEYEYLNLSTANLFWFSPPTLNPIVLFEYGKYMNRNKPLFIGCDPEYARREDVILQTEVERPEIKIANSLDELVTQVKNWYYNYPRRIIEICSKGMESPPEDKDKILEKIIQVLGINLDLFYSDQAKKGLNLSLNH